MRAHVYIYVRVYVVRNFTPNLACKLSITLVYRRGVVILAAHPCIKQRRQQINKIVLNNLPNAIYYVCIFNQRCKLSLLDDRQSCLINRGRCVL